MRKQQQNIVGFARGLQFLDAPSKPVGVFSPAGAGLSTMAAALCDGEHYLLLLCDGIWVVLNLH